MKCLRWGALGITAGVCCALLSGCIGATRLPTRNEGPTGATLQKNDIDLTFLQAGTTRREEVINRLSRIDTGYSNPRLFWGRWRESKWGFVYAGVGGGAERAWHARNLLVSFDENGVMQTKALIGDEKTLERELRARLAKTPPLDLSQPMPVELTPLLTAEASPMYRLFEMTLTKEAMRVRYIGQSTFTEISPLDVGRISYGGSDYSPGSDSICHSLHLAEKTPRGKKTLFCTSAANLATIFKYLQQTGPPNMRWE
jgi:hypothetical protein